MLFGCHQWSLGETQPGGAEKEGCRQGKGSPAVPVTQEEAKVRSVRKEEEEEKDFRGKETQKNTLTLLSCSLGRRLLGFCFVVFFVDFFFSAKGRFSLTSGSDEPQSEDREPEKSPLEVRRLSRWISATTGPAPSGAPRAHPRSPSRLFAS